MKYGKVVAPPLVLSALPLIALLFCTCGTIQGSTVSEPGETGRETGKKQLITWHAVLVAGSYSDDGKKIDNWDNALEGMVPLLFNAGLSEDTIRMHSSNPQTIGQGKQGIIQAPAWKTRISRSINDFHLTDGDGLILYLTSHGLDDKGLYLESEERFRNVLTPGELDGILDLAGDVPVLVFISACYSGDFLRGEEHIVDENRLILTASDEDRSSFGCGAGSFMPEWDDTLLNVLADGNEDTRWEDVISDIIEDIERKETGFSEDNRSHPQAYLPDPLHPGFQELLRSLSNKGGW